MDNSESAHELILELLKVRMAFRQAIQQALKQHDIDMTFEMLQIMHRLWKQEGVSQQSLAEKTAKDKACLTNLINNLEKKNWVERREDPTDRRNRLIFLTPDGASLSGKVLPLLQGVYVQIGHQMNPKQIQSCLSHLKKLNEIFNEI